MICHVAFIPLAWQEYHPFRLYLDELPIWDGIDRLADLARRVSTDSAWVKEFHVWMLGMTAQWMGIMGEHANSVAPLLCQYGAGVSEIYFL